MAWQYLAVVFYFSKEDEIFIPCCDYYELNWKQLKMDFWRCCQLLSEKSISSHKIGHWCHHLIGILFGLSFLRNIVYHYIRHIKISKNLLTIFSSTEKNGWFPKKTLSSSSLLPRIIHFSCTLWLWCKVYVPIIWKCSWPQRWKKPYGCQVKYRTIWWRIWIHDSCDV